VFQVSGRAAAALAALLLAPVPSVAQESDWPGRAYPDCRALYA